MNKLIELEKYSKGKNKMTYIMVPSNHPKLKFPLNLEDRIEYIKTNVNKILSKNVNFKENTDSKNKSISILKIETSKNDNKKDFNKMNTLNYKISNNMTGQSRLSNTNKNNDQLINVKTLQNKNSLIIAKKSTSQPKIYKASKTMVTKPNQKSNSLVFNEYINKKDIVNYNTNVSNNKQENFPRNPKTSVSPVKKDDKKENKEIKKDKKSPKKRNDSFSRSRSRDKSYKDEANSVNSNYINNVKANIEKDKVSLRLYFY